MNRAHGTDSRYVGGCRCDACRDARRRYQAESNRRRQARMIAGEVTPPHGRNSTYNNYGCRCEPCRAAKAVVNAKTQARRKAAAT